MPEHRITQHGRPLDYTCNNAKFKTNIAKGEPHGNCPTGGSVFNKPLVVYQGGSLWLEHVQEHENPDEPFYWLMHYDHTGYPTIPLSGVMGKDDLQEMARLMASLVP
jgi:hypothetical protein